MRIGLLMFVVAVLAGCTAPAGVTSSTSPDGRLEVRAVAGPVCPVERQPPDPDCAPRPVAGAVIVVTPGDGREILIARGVTDERGIVALEIPPGAYRVSGSEANGLFGRPADVTVSVLAGESASVTLEYDTGIR